MAELGGERFREEGLAHARRPRECEHHARAFAVTLAARGHQQVGKERLAHRLDGLLLAKNAPRQGRTEF
ncbi:hypothetical protein CCR91_07285 [Thiorhodovibrio winogradskyi]|nr:hypothetical protein [Thiorhodovibrio winogradskyi]